MKKILGLIAIIMILLVLVGGCMIIKDQDESQGDFGGGESQGELLAEKTDDLSKIDGTGDENTEFQGENALIPVPEPEFRVLINKENAVDRDYVPGDLKLVKKRASDRAESNQYMISTAAEAFDALTAAAEAEGHEIVVTTAYRSYDFQSTLYNNYVAKDGQEAADKYSARPGTSEHQSGLAADVSSPSVNYALTSKYADTEEGKWLAANCKDYGFIIRFPEGKTDITGYIYEPWHIRYVGIEPAKYIMENNLTLEEYMDLIADLI